MDRLESLPATLRNGSLSRTRTPRVMPVARVMNGTPVMPATALAVAMHVSVVLLLAASAGCTGEGADPAFGAPERPAEPSELLLQAVDAGTGAALADTLLTVRHLVRFPLTLDASAVERVAAARPHRIAHAVSLDSLVLELRLEADSYHRLDTVFTVARGASAGPVTVRMARRLDRSSGTPRPEATTAAAPTAMAPDASAPTGTTSTATATAGPPATTGATGAPGAAPAPPPAGATGRPSDPDAGADRTALVAGDRAFGNQEWAQATNAYTRMQPPASSTSSYARDYVQALVRRGQSHIHLGEWGGALDALLEATDFDAPGWNAYMLLGQAECAVGRVDAGRRSLGEVERLAPTIPGGERPVAQALLEYQRAMCSQYEFDRAQDPRALMQTGTLAIREFQSFIDRGEALRPATPAVTAAVEDSRRRIADIRQRLQTGGD